ncbi:unnamed protein product, partial [Rotaria socialis]
LQSSFMSDVPLVFAPSPVPSMIPSSPTTSSSSSSNSNKRSSIILPLRSVS